MDKRCKIYLPSDWMYGDATAFYVDIIADAMKVKGYKTSIIKKVNEIDCNDVVLTVASYNVKEVYDRHPQKIINWFQGIAPEETFFFLDKNKSLIERIKSYVRLSKSDYIGLKYSDFNFFVSDRMRDFYKRKFFYYKNNYFIMPCFNQTINKEGFNDKKYSKPSFVYAGSMDGWQCFDKTVQIFVKILEKLPAATFTVLTSGKEIAKMTLEKYGVNADIKYVPYTQVDEELQKYKYGFIIRENNIVNNVATPTKMNSYLANGIIPIYTDVIDAFSKNLSILKYAIPLSTNEEGLKKLFSLESETITANNVFDDFINVFCGFYSRDKYIEKIVNSSLLR